VRKKRAGGGYTRVLSGTTSSKEEVYAVSGWAWGWANSNREMMIVPIIAQNVKDGLKRRRIEP